MRTTVHLPDDLLRLAKRKAAAEGRTLTSLIEEGLRAVVMGRPATAARKKRKPLPISSACDGVVTGVDLSRSAELQAILDEHTVRESGLVKLR